MVALPLPHEVESALLADFLDPAISLVDLADRHGLDIRSLVEWAQSAATQSLLGRLRAVLSARAAVIAAQHAPDAAATLASTASRALAESVDSPEPALRLRALESARRSASQILRLGAPRPARPAPKFVESIACETDPALLDADGLKALQPDPDSDTGRRPIEPLAGHHEEPSAGPSSPGAEPGAREQHPDCPPASTEKAARGDPRGRPRSAQMTCRNVS